MLESNKSYKKRLDIIIVVCLICLVVLGSFTFIEWKKNVEHLKTHPCEICEQQGNIIFNISESNIINYTINNDNNK